MSYYIFNKSTGKAKGPVTLQEPDSNPEHHEYGSQYHGSCVDEWDRYNDHVASLPEISVHPDLIAIWEANGKYYEGRDFQIKLLQYTEQGSSLYEALVPPPTIPCTVKQLSEIYTAGATECFNFCGLPSEFPEYVKRQMVDYFKKHFGIDLLNTQS